MGAGHKIRATEYRREKIQAQINSHVGKLFNEMSVKKFNKEDERFAELVRNGVIIREGAV